MPTGSGEEHQPTTDADVDPVARVRRAVLAGHRGALHDARRLQHDPLPAARSAALGASSAAPASSSAAAAPVAAPSARRSEEVAEAFVHVGGVFESPARVLAEVSVNGVAYLLAAGQPRFLACTP